MIKETTHMTVIEVGETKIETTNYDIYEVRVMEQSPIAGIVPTNTNQQENTSE